jgi:hypothetical protein
MIVTHDVGKSIEVQAVSRGDVAWNLDYHSRPKPFFHPVRTPQGHTLSIAEPFDHLWHRGLWFTFKFVNGDNFWEERDGFASQLVRGIPQIAHGDAETMTITKALDWVRPDGDSVVLTEYRTITYRERGDTRAFDWTTVITAQDEVELDRTAYTTWGGYGGLSFRGSRSWHVERYLLPDGPVECLTPGARGEWCDLSGSIDGGPGLKGGIAILDHPENRRHPTPWYSGSGSGTFINAALLFHEPMSLAKGEELRLRYRVLVHDGVWDADRLASEYARFTSGTAKNSQGMT